MTLTFRKVVVLGLIALISLLGNALLVANWLQENGLVDWAKGLRKEYLAGTAVAVIVALLILLVRPAREANARRRWINRCPVCDHVLLGRGKYCSECGSRA